MLRRLQIGPAEVRDDKVRYADRRKKTRGNERIGFEACRLVRQSFESSGVERLESDGQLN